jgi:hypothetical protein
MVMEMAGLPLALAPVEEALGWFAFGAIVAFFCGMAFRGWWIAHRPHPPSSA